MHEYRTVVFLSPFALSTLWPCKASYYDFARTFSDDSNCRAATYKTCFVAAREFVQNLMEAEADEGLEMEEE